MLTTALLVLKNSTRPHRKRTAVTPPPHVATCVRSEVSLFIAPIVRRLRSEERSDLPKNSWLGSDRVWGHMQMDSLPRASKVMTTTHSKGCASEASYIGWKMIPPFSPLRSSACASVPASCDCSVTSLPLPLGCEQLKVIVIFAEPRLGTRPCPVTCLLNE